MHRKIRENDRDIGCSGGNTGTRTGASNTPEESRNDRGTLWRVMHASIGALQHASNGIKKHPRFILTAMEQHEEAL